MTGEELRDKRLERGWTMDRLAELMGYQSPSRKKSVDQLEKGRRQIRGPILTVLNIIFATHPPNQPVPIGKKKRKR